MKEPAGALPDRDQWMASKFAACWLGHATALLRVDDLTIITDPHFEERAGVDIAGRRIGRRRSIALPGGANAVELLPPIDVVLLSHAHLDHWDRLSLARLAQKRTTAVIPQGTRRLLPQGFGQVIELPWHHEALAHDVRLTALRPKHWGARWLLDRRKGYNSYVVEAGGRRVLFAGDTAATDAFDPLGQGPRAGVDLAVMGVGGYHHWDHSHATPEEVAEMARRMRARLLMPVHHSTFHDQAEPPGEAIERLCRVWDPGALVCPEIGGVWFEEQRLAEERAKSA